PPARYLEDQTPPTPHNPPCPVGASSEPCQGAEGGGDSGKAGDGKSGGKGGGRKGGSGKEPPATVEKLDSAMESYWGNGKAADEGKGEEGENGTATAMEGEEEEAPPANSAIGNGKEEGDDENENN
ncbi:unnamed protein product, partial [Pylaiella littoralis]